MSLDQPSSSDPSTVAIEPQYSDASVYRSVSRGAIAAFILSIVGLGAFVMPSLLLLSIVAIVFGGVAMFSIRRYPDELLGKPLAIAGVCLGTVTVIGGTALHTYIYMTEVPEGYARLDFGVLQSASNAQDRPPAAALDWNDKDVFIKGYIHPSSMDTMMSKKFVLIPDLGTCCFGGQPPLTNMVEVTLTGDQYATKNMRQQKLAGRLSINPNLKPVDDLTGVYYQLRADILK